MGYRLCAAREAKRAEYQKNAKDTLAGSNVTVALHIASDALRDLASNFSQRSWIKLPRLQHAARDNGWYQALKPAYAAIQIALKNFSLTEGIKKSRAIWQLMNLYVLAFIAQEEFLDMHFNAMYAYALAEIKTENTLIKIRRVLPYHIWSREEEIYRKNPFVILIKDVMSPIIAEKK